MKYFHHPIDVGCKYRQNYLIFKQISRKKTLLSGEKEPRFP